MKVAATVVLDGHRIECKFCRNSGLGIAGNNLCSGCGRWLRGVRETPDKEDA